MCLAAGCLQLRTKRKTSPRQKYEVRSLMSETISGIGTAAIDVHRGCATRSVFYVTNSRIIFFLLLLPPPQVRLRGCLQPRWRQLANDREVLREDRSVSHHFQRRPAAHQVCVRLRDARGRILRPLRGLQDRCVAANAGIVKEPRLLAGSFTNLHCRTCLHVVLCRVFF